MGEAAIKEEKIKEEKTTKKWTAKGALKTAVTWTGLFGLGVAAGLLYASKGSGGESDLNGETTDIAYE